MKALMIGSLLLLLGLSCKKPVEPVGPGGTTPLGTIIGPDGIPTTNVSSFTAVVPPALTAKNCRVIQASYKFTGLSTNEAKERIVTPYGDFIVTQGHKVNYIYDRVGRVIQEVSTGGISFNYEYLTDSIAFTYTEGNKKLRWSSRLNEKQLSVYRFFGSELQIEYNSEGYAIGYFSESKQYPTRFTINKGNVTGERWYALSGDTAYETTYYNDRLNLPPIRTHWGRESRNLPKQVIASRYGDPFYDDGPVSQTDYYYVYDSRGLVKRKIVTLKPLLKRGTLFGKELTQIVDYEYECP